MWGYELHFISMPQEWETLLKHFSNTKYEVTNTQQYMPYTSVFLIYSTKLQCKTLSSWH
jgi:hypothetical protein